MRERAKGYKVKEINSIYGYSRQAYYKRRGREEEQNQIKQEVIEFVLKKRHRQPQEGAKKLYLKFRKERNIKIGRDRFIDVMRDAKLLVERKRRYARTTDSRHGFRTYKNMVKNLTDIKVGTVIVGDITYLDTDEGFCFLSLLTDMTSRKIIGYEVSDRLMVEGSLKALDMAIRILPKNARFIHHSDRGVQYCCHAYINRLGEVNAQVSMTEEDHVYENALAERVNGILKQEFGLWRKFSSIEEARRAVKEAIEIYNGERLHMSLGYQTPNEVFSFESGQWN